MHPDYHKVYMFHEAFDLTYHNSPDSDALRNERLISLRLGLINEEFKEFQQAFDKHDLTGMIDALADTIYVVYGTGVSFGIELCPYPIDRPRLSMQIKSFIDRMDKLIDDLTQQLKTDCHVDPLRETLNHMLTLNYGMGYVLGVDMSVAFDLVHQSNMTKLCNSEQEATESVNWYLMNEINRYDTPAWKKSKDDKYWIIYNRSTGKVLKNIHYRPVDLTQIPIDSNAVTYLK